MFQNMRSFSSSSICNLYSSFSFTVIFFFSSLFIFFFLLMTNFLSSNNLQTVLSACLPLSLSNLISPPSHSDCLSVSHFFLLLSLCLSFFTSLSHLISLSSSSSWSLFSCFSYSAWNFRTSSWSTFAWRAFMSLISSNVSISSISFLLAFVLFSRIWKFKTNHCKALQLKKKALFICHI